eukprot:TRINITY_DN33158_c0_g1_i1.p1 TRINITY_DN33158_c0_g1~~TRINITY_DN33158_c0_g1_i1.p1  ORF type:complete len:332 (+),score=60.16 TRINITY_DN33158_c0_g1_i1:113-997(+)
MAVLSVQQQLDLIRSTEKINNTYDGFVAVNFTLPAGVKVYEKRIALLDNFAAIKGKAASHFGIDASELSAAVRRDGAIIARNVADTTTALELNLQDGDTIVFTPSASAALAFKEVTDTSLVEKYVMPDEVYDQREGTVRAKKRELQRLAALRGEPDPFPDPKTLYPAFEGKIGDRCRLKLGDVGHRGVVKFAGEVPGLRPGQTWVGIELDEPAGKNDGEVKGTRLFSCRPRHGVLVRVPDVEVGDFPPVEDDMDAELAAILAESEGKEGASAAAADATADGDKAEKEADPAGSS